MWKMEKGFTGNDSTSISSSSATVNNNNSNGSSGCTSSNRDMYLKQLNRNSLKISKPIRKQTNPLPPTIPIPDPNPQISGQTQQPPVYNINKNDFRDVVQKLTGSPVHYDRPPVAAQPRPSSSRLQRIRPPPLAQIVNRPPQFNPIIPPRPQNDVIAAAAAAAQQQNFSLLPPLPSVHPAAESPVSAYMRFRQSSDSLLLQNGVGQQLGQMSSPASDYVRSFLNPGYSSPRWNSVAPPPSSPQLPLLPPLQQPNSPYSMPFGCVPSPRSQYGMLSPNMLFPQTGQMGWPQLPLSPTLPVSSPRWKGI